MKALRLAGACIDDPSRKLALWSHKRVGSRSYDQMHIIREDSSATASCIISHNATICNSRELCNRKARGLRYYLKLIIYRRLQVEVMPKLCG